MIDIYKQKQTKRFLFGKFNLFTNHETTVTLSVAILSVKALKLVLAVLTLIKLFYKHFSQN